MTTIMIIDDDIDLLETLEEALSGADTKVVTRDTTEGALDSMLQERPDLLILDVMFPGDPAAGFDLARKIKAHQELSLVPIILLTGINRELPGNLSREDIGDDWFPVQDLIEKPVDLTRLRSRVKELLEAPRK